MQKLNEVEYQFPRGYGSIELWQGDITEFKEAEILVISSIGESYRPTPNSVVRSLLERHGLSIQALADGSTLDFRKPLKTWLSEELRGLPFKWILCTCIPFGGDGHEEAVKQAFVTLLVAEARLENLATVGMPVLGAGNHGEILTDEQMLNLISQLVIGASQFLERANSIRRICFVEIDKARAEKINEAFNRHLRRSSITLAKGRLADAVRFELQHLLKRAEKSDSYGLGLYADMQRFLLKEKSQSFEIGSLGRKFAEHVCNGILGDSASGIVDLNKKISLLAGNPKIAQWIPPYLHLLRAMGNNVVHQSHGQRHPSSLSSEDLVLCLAAISRVLTFWLDDKDELALR